MSSTQYTRIPKFLNDLSERPFKLFLQFPPAWTKAKPVRLSHTHTKHSSSFHTQRARFISVQRMGQMQISKICKWHKRALPILRKIGFLLTQSWEEKSCFYSSFHTFRGAVNIWDWLQNTNKQTSKQNADTQAQWQLLLVQVIVLGRENKFQQYFFH